MILFRFGLGLALAAFGCRGDDADDRDGRAARDAGSIRPNAARDGSKPDDDPRGGGGAAHTPSPICASCQPHVAAGGDTTDFGGAEPRPSCTGAGWKNLRAISLEEAETAGFDPRAVLALHEGRHEFTVRWNDRSRTEPTTLVATLRSTGRAMIATWMQMLRAGDPPDVLPCPEQWVWPEVEVEIATADGAVEGRFTGRLFTKDPPPTLPDWVASELDGYWEVSGDGSGLLGDLAFEPPAVPHRLVASLDVFSGGSMGARGHFDLTLRAREQLMMSNGIMDLWLPYQAYEALPVDGCGSLSLPTAPCEPWSQVQVAPEAPTYMERYLGNVCCNSHAWVPPVDSDADAGGPSGP